MRSTDISKATDEVRSYIESLPKGEVLQYFSGNKVVTVNKAGKRSVVSVPDAQTMCQQQFQRECDINHIIKRIEATGQQIPAPGASGVYADLTDIGDLQSAIARVRRAQDAFAILPAEVRARFSNDPAQLVSFLESSRPEDIEESIKLKLRVQKTPAPAPDASAVAVPPKA